MYQKRHTAVVLHLAAGENLAVRLAPARRLSTEMLSERYAPFVANALADDGSQFERMMDGVEGG